VDCLTDVVGVGTVTSRFTKEEMMENTAWMKDVKVGVVILNIKNDVSKFNLFI
jgi:hypothetical protein